MQRTNICMRVCLFCLFREGPFYVVLGDIKTYLPSPAYFALDQISSPQLMSLTTISLPRRSPIKTRGWVARAQGHP